MDVKVILQTETGTPRKCKVLTAKILKEGSRTVDSATITFPPNTSLYQGDKIKYLQDNVDMSYLTAVYNFQGAVLDESGYNLDATGTVADDRIMTPYGDPPAINGHSYQNQKRNLMNYGVIYDDNKDIVTHNEYFDFSNQFDIIIMASNLAGTSTLGYKRILFSKLDISGNGIEIGLIYKNDPLSTAFWTGYAKVRYDTTTERTYEQTMEIIDNNVTIGHAGTAHKTYMLRLWRNSENMIQFSLNDNISGSWYNGATALTSELDTTDTVNSPTPYSLSNTKDIWIGAGRNTSTEAAENYWLGVAYQLKIYTGGYLSESDSSLMQKSSPTPMTIKFSGTVNSIKDDIATRTADCKGDSDIILNHSFYAGQFTNSLPDDATIVTRKSIASVKTNIYPTSATSTQIMKSLIMLADSSYKIIDNSNTPWLFEGNFIAEGSFLPIVKNMLSIMGRANFWTNGRKTIFIESNNGVFTDITYENITTDSAIAGVKITSMSKSDDYLINSVEILGRTKYNHITQIEGNNSGTTTLTYFPINLSIFSNGSGFTQKTFVEGTDFTIDYDNRLITYIVTSPLLYNIVIEYDYESISSTSDSYYKTKSDSSITTYNTHHRRIYAPQLTIHNDLVSLGDKVLTQFTTINQRYEVVLPYLANNIRENYKVFIKNKYTEEVLNGVSTELVIKQIEWRYPELITILQVGENLIDGFDLDDVQSSTLSSSLSNLQKTKN